jgi:hypothetical protein
MDFLIESGAVVDLECNKMSFTDSSRVPTASSETLVEQTALTVFKEGKEGHSPQPKQLEAQSNKRQSIANNCPEKTTTQSRTWLVKAKENITMAPWSRQVVIGKLEFEEEQNPPTLVCVEPVPIPIEGILPARALTRVGPSARMTSQSDNRAKKSPDTRAYVMLANFSEETVVIPKATVVGLEEEVSETIVNKINSPRESDSTSPNRPLYQKLLNGKLDHLTQADKELIEPLLLKYTHIFHDEGTNDFKGLTSLSIKL